MPRITENGNTYWMPEVLPVPTKEYQATQEEKRYLTEEGIERMHPGWTYAENVAYVDDEYLFQNDGWKLVIDEAPLEPVINKTHRVRNAPEDWNEIDERTIEVTYTLNGWIPEIFPTSTLEYQQTQSDKRYLTPDGEERIHPQWKYVETNAYVDDEYLFQNDSWKLIIDEAPLEPVINKTHRVRNAPEDWNEIGERTIEVTYTLNGWIPEVFPTSTLEYQQTQSDKRYLTEEGEVKSHPQWKYVETNAYVDDEYLFQNDSWKLIIDDEGPVILDTDLKHKTRNEIVDWEEQEGEKTIKVTYTIVDFSEEEVVEYTKQQWKQLRKKRFNLIYETDWIITKVYEQNLVASTEVIAYRQALRDFPETITNILEFDIKNDALWPIKPEIYFAV